MYSNGYSSRRSSSRYYPVSSGSGYPRSRSDNDSSDQMEYILSSHRRHERSQRAEDQHADGLSERQSADTSRSTHRASRRTTHSSGYGSSYISSRSNTDRTAHHQDYPRVVSSSRSRTPTRASTVYPDDSISSAGFRTHLQRDAETRGRSAVLVDRRSHRTSEGYPPTIPSFSSHQYSRSSRNSRTFESGPTYSYVPPSRSERASEVNSDISSSSVTHPFAYDDSGRTHTWHPPPRYQSSESSHRSRRSTAPSSDSRVSNGQAATGACRSVASSRTPFPPRRVHGYSPPPPTPVLRGRSRSNFSSIYSAMEDTAYDSNVEHPFS